MWFFSNSGPTADMSKARCEQLAAKFYGPYKVLERVGVVAYKLELPPEACIHDVFHVSQLKKCIRTVAHVQNHPPSLSDEFELQVTRKTVLGVRWNNKMGKEVEKIPRE